MGQTEGQAGDMRGSCTQTRPQGLCVTLGHPPRGAAGVGRGCWLTLTSLLAQRMEGGLGDV